MKNCDYILLWGLVKLHALSAQLQTKSFNGNINILLLTVMFSFVMWYEYAYWLIAYATNMTVTIYINNNQENSSPTNAFTSLLDHQVLYLFDLHQSIVSRLAHPGFICVSLCFSFLTSYMALYRNDVKFFTTHWCRLTLSQLYMATPFQFAILQFRWRRVHGILTVRWCKRRPSETNING